MHIGFISPFWLPHHGGASQHEHRIAQELINRGVNLSVFTSTKMDPERDNGSVDASRWDGPKLSRVWPSEGTQRVPPAHLFPHFDFMSAAVEWVKANEINIVVLGISYQEAHQLHVRELYRQLKAIGIKVGLFHYDLAKGLRTALAKQYIDSGSDWAGAAEAIELSIQNVFRHRSYLEACYMIGSPLFFEPDFTISCSNWSDRFIDPENRIPRFVLHQFMDPDYWAASLPSDQLLPERDILMINPQKHKGPGIMLNIIKYARSDLTFRVLKGGWGDAFSTFMPKLKELPAFAEGRVDAIDYVYDIRSAYRSARAFLFPSTYEGYGMVAVEPMYGGTPVVSSNYPAITEAVGDGALSLCPFRSSAGQWRDAMHEVLENPAPWKTKSLARTTELMKRQNHEISALIKFFRNIF